MTTQFNKQNTKFSVPLQWNDDFLDMISQLDTRYQVKDFYGCLNFTPFTSGRIPLTHQNITRNEACRLVNRIHSSGRRFLYLINASDYSESSIKEKRTFLQFLQNELMCDALVVSDLAIAMMARNCAPKLAIHISTIASIDTDLKLSHWLDFNPSRIVLPHDLPKKPYLLRNILKTFTSFGIETEIMVTESCIFECPWRQEHYQTLGQGKDDTHFHSYCLQRRIKNPLEFLTAGSFILPQDLYIYENLGIHCFKITGRSKSQTWIKNTLSTYLNNLSPENAIDLMGLNPQITPERWIRIPSSIFNGMLKQFFELENTQWKEFVTNFAKDRKHLINLETQPKD